MSLSPAQSAPCWCFAQKIPQSLIDLVPASSQHRHCICQRCVNAFESDPVAFQQRYCSG
nr:cysteine-rich CWC family protein [Paraglaciecola sp. T6c]